MPYTLEVCVDSTASALAAQRGGADRLELCADLIVGGTTPSLALVRQVKETTGLPVRALLRPRFGDFCYDRWELAQMKESAAALVAAGADGIVTGVLTPDGALDAEALRPIYEAAREAAGDDVDIIMENHSYPDALGAVQLAKLAEKYNIMAFEEPNTPTTQTVEYIAKYSSVPIANGQRLYSRWK